MAGIEPQSSGSSAPGAASGSASTMALNATELPPRSLAARLGLTSVPRDELRRRYTQSSSNFVRIMGADVHYVDEGSGDIIVMVHGFASSLHTWNRIADELKHAYRVIRLDLPPFGVTGPLRSSTGAIETMNLPTYRRFIDTFLQALGVSRAIFIGNSLGGLISWDYAVRHREAVERLVLIDSAGFPMKLPIYIGLFNSALVRASSPRWLPEIIIRSAVRNVYGDPRKIDAVTLRRYVEFFHGEGTRAAIGKMVPTLDFAKLDTNVLTTLTVPTLVLWGAKDRWIPTAHAAEFARRIPGAKSVMYPGLGHIPMEEAPERVLPDLRAFLGSNVSNSASSSAAKPLPEKGSRRASA
ncbi:2-succinyl-6-hydroxy-2, 4-cyclohexadiene-1-carboxylate synthase [Paraburkholderia kirstenboschensis]|uniref:alpha/beta fold hydrolase n=1 Tax=Paraburkholderia kirstenboschensis TaxID=1245436 RepID=UPI00191842CE|nr:alpha/beta hydrolase [Paraburkholderia kirstenboschensis]CAD6521221.1 2-succinyl-6-hydroxy-2, 4-cyclohexadiene-1-carboxylate synthase [Paraburkholderia kirstenboschensis]